MLGEAAAWARLPPPEIEVRPGRGDDVGAERALRGPPRRRGRRRAVVPEASEETGETTTTVASTDAAGPALETGVIAAVYLVPLENDTATTTAEQRALARRDELRAQGYQAEVLNTTDYPQLANAAGNFWFVYVRGFTDLPAADQFCQTGDFPTCASYDLSPD